MPDHAYVYKNQASEYDRLISRQPELFSVVDEIRSVQDLDIVDIGAGTGRLTTALAPHAHSILALDSSAEMLALNEQKLKQLGCHNWKTQVTDLTIIPAEDHSIDLIVAGWSICYAAHSNAPNHKENIEKMMDEMKRVLRPGGTIIIFETMGTGYETPNPPNFLENYYSILENHYGFKHKWIRLDYQFKDIAEAEGLTQFFFGEVLSERVVKDNLLRLPECAGVWWLTLEV